jgi:membrane protease YdiL (CAAX protease family)
LGHGPDPIPLFVLALILGYMYQRTHRIVPSIVTHLLFNLTSLVMLWMVIRNGGVEVP